ncbi:serine hydrolase domain-containing protein [Plantactinospora siamensis]|uniref:Serine hydrolase domain-containing protein n=1 Tax=Plantactinospora siamensis TaxID=555372 RepID=A0ABV6P425_9ACTN
MNATVTGMVEPPFAPVREVFAELCASGAETGAALSVIHHGRPVVELYGGSADAAGARGWAADTVVNAFSVGKPVAALCVLVLVDRGRLDLEDPVRQHWPEFSGADVLVRHLLSHTAGLPAFPVPRPAEAFADWDVLCADLAATAPEWPPGTAAAEHALTYGHLVGELVRRVDGRSVGRFLAEEIAGPWRLDLGFGLDAEDQRRCAELEYGDPDWPRRMIGAPGSPRRRMVGNPAGYLALDVLNGSLWRGAEVPAVNLHTTATGLARFYAGLLAGGVLDGVRLLRPETVAEAVRVRYDGPDLLLGRRVQWTLGMQVEDDGTWGMGGLGGNVGYADPRRAFTFGYVTRRLGDFDRVDALVKVVERLTG